MRGVARLGRFRSLAESRMGAINGASDANVWRKNGIVTKDYITLRDLQGFDLINPEAIPVRLAGTAANSAPYRTLDPGGVQVEQAARVLHFPVTFADLRDGDVVELVAGENAGSFWRLLEVTWQDQATARRIPVVQIDRPGGLNSRPA